MTTPSAEETPEHTEETAEHDLWNIRKWMIGATVMLNLLGLAGIGITAYVVIQNRDFTSCQRGYNEDVVRVLTERSSAGDLDRAAARTIASSTTDMVDALFLPGASQENIREAIRKWRDAQDGVKNTLQEADDKRAAAPLPAPRHC